MNAEQLKVIAEGMGYVAVPSALQTTISIMRVDESTNNLRDYEPITNAKQCMEIMEKLKMSMHFDESERWYLTINNSSIAKFAKTINEAVCNAAYEYFKGAL